MSQCSPPTNLLLACLAALGVMPVLATPWFAHSQTAPPAEAGGTIEPLAAQIAAVFTSSGVVVTGTDAMTTGESILMAVAAATIVLAAAMMVPALRALARGPLRLVPLAGPAIVLVHVFEQPGANGAVDLRWGVFAALALTSFMASAALQGAEMAPARPAPRPYTPPTFGS